MNEHFLIFFVYKIKTKFFLGKIMSLYHKEEEIEAFSREEKIGLLIVVALIIFNILIMLL